MERDILLLGNPRLYEISEEVKREGVNMPSICTTL